MALSITYRKGRKVFESQVELFFYYEEEETEWKYHVIFFSRSYAIIMYI